jgi:hypothetical protein
MAPALLPGDWLLLDPTGRRWPRPGSIVVVREPGAGALAIKRVAARGSRGGAATRGRGGGLEPREAWLLGDAPAGSIDSRTYGPLDADAFVARAWFRYGPPGRIGRLPLTSGGRPGRRSHVHAQTDAPGGIKRASPQSWCRSALERASVSSAPVSVAISRSPGPSPEA